MQYAEQFYFSQLSAVTISLVQAGHSPDAAPEKARAMLSEVRRLAALEAEANPMPDPAEEMMRRQAEVQAEYAAKRAAAKTGPVDPDKAIDYDASAKA